MFISIKDIIHVFSFKSILSISTAYYIIFDLKERIFTLIFILESNLNCVTYLSLEDVNKNKFTN